MFTWFRRSFVLKVGAFATVLALLVAVGAGLMSYLVARSQLQDMRMQELAARSRLIATHFSAEMKNLAENLAAMASNTLMANALADSAGRDHYLRPFLGSYPQVNSIPVSIALCDFRGRILSRNPVPQFVPLDQAMLERVVDSGHPLQRIGDLDSGVAITLAWPVLYANTGLAEGVLTYQFMASSLSFTKLSNEQGRGFRVLFSKGESRHALLQGESPPADAVFQRSEAVLPEIFGGWVAAVEVWESGGILTQEMSNLAGGYIVIGLAGMVLVVPLCMGSARWLASRLQHLEAVAREVTEKRSPELRFPQEGQDEISSLGRMSNLMLDELNRAYQELKSDAGREVRLHSERLRRVLSSTLEGYVRINVETGRIEEVNEAFRRMVGTAQDDWVGQPVPLFLDPIMEMARSVESSSAWIDEGEACPTEDMGAFSFLAKCNIDVSPEGIHQLVIFLTDISELKAAEARLYATNRKLVESVKSLEQRNQTRALLNRMNELLLAAQSKEDAYSVVQFCAEQFYPGVSGALAILDQEAGKLETVVRWGEDCLMADGCRLQDCWGMRQGSNFEILPSGSGLRCQHFCGEPRKGSLCIPLSVQGRTLGLLWSDLAGKVDDPDTRETIRRLAIALADSIKLALSNIELREALRAQAIRDILTGLYNRRHFQEVVVHELARAKRTGSPLSLGMIDLDHFKSLNDTFGHDAGDQVLRELGTLLIDGVRSTDIPFRIGGEEFVVLFPGTDKYGAAKRMENLRVQLEALRIHHNGVSLGTVTMSVGLAQFLGGGNEREELLRVADEALYRAKQAGRNRVEIAA